MFVEQPVSAFGPEDSLWIFQSSAVLTSPQSDLIAQSLKSFFNEWATHGKTISASFEIRHNLFVLVAAESKEECIGGCSRDSLFKVFKDLHYRTGLQFLDPARIAYKTADGIKICSRDEFRVKISTGEVSPETIVYNNTLTKVSELLGGMWETQAKNSWHARAFHWPEAQPALSP